MRNLKALQAYLEVATLGSVTAAARQLNMSQPSVSRMIQDLERDLGQPLFERAGQRLVLTQVGMLLRDDVERALASVSDVMVRARMLGDNPVRPLRIATVSSVGFGLLPHAWNHLDHALRGEIMTEVASPEMVRSKVREASVDFGAGSLPLEHRDLRVEWMGSAPSILAVPEGDPLADCPDPIELPALKGRTMIALGNQRGLPSRIRGALRKAGLAPATVQTNSTMNALAYVRAGAGISVVEPFSASGTPVPGVRLLPLAVPIPYFIGVVTPLSARPCARGARLVTALRETALDLVPGFVPADPAEHQDIIARLAISEDHR